MSTDCEKYLDHWDIPTEIELLGWILYHSSIFLFEKTHLTSYFRNRV